MQASSRYWRLRTEETREAAAVKRTTFTRPMRGRALMSQRTALYGLKLSWRELSSIDSSDLRRPYPERRRLKEQFQCRPSYSPTSVTGCTSYLNWTRTGAHMRYARRRSSPRRSCKVTLRVEGKIILPSFVFAADIPCWLLIYCLFNYENWTVHGNYKSGVFAGKLF